MCSHMHPEFTQAVRNSCSGITGSASESLSQEKKKRRKKLLQNMQIYLTLNKTNCVSNASVHCDNSVMFPMQFCPFNLSGVGTVWLLKCSASQAAASDVSLLSYHSVLLCPCVSPHLLSFFIRFSVHV